MSLISHLSKALTEALSTLEFSTALIKLSPPKNPEFGDLSSNIALILSKAADKPPLEIAQDIKKNLKIDSSLVNKITVTAPGFINFRISPDYYYSVLKNILTDPEFGRGKQGAGENANVEFVSANPTGPLTVGHGRQAVLGDAVANILEWNGYSVTREYYYNDGGRQMRILGQSVEARYYQESGQDSPLPEGGYQGDYIRKIARRILADKGPGLKSGDSIFLLEAEKTIFSDIKATLKDLGIIHDKFSNEKTFYETGAVDKMVEDLREKNFVYESEGATWFRTTELGMEKDRVLIKKSGEPTYRLPDMAYHRNKLERNFNLIVDIFGADHADTYPDVLAALKILDYDVSRVRVLLHQFVTLIKDGKKIKMSTRKADFVTLRELTDKVGSDVVRYFFIMRGMNSHLNFDLDLAADQSEKNPVFYLQYAHARICNIIKRGTALKQLSINNYNPHLLKKPAELDLLKKLEQFPAAIETALESL
ncbi:MAG: arginine--tRNA ligase, partial [Candidatus Neomarinimicrobiota bacterium]